MWRKNKAVYAFIILLSGAAIFYFLNPWFGKASFGNDNSETEKILKNLEENFMQFAIIENWEFRQIETNTWYRAEVPGTVHNDLLINGVIKDPFYSLNEKDVQWIEEKDWEYKTVFEVDQNLIQKQVIELVFDGLDTYADVYLNNHLILSSDNMFVGYKVDCKEYLVEGENELRIYFHSPVAKGMEKLQKLDYILPATNEQAPPDQRTNVFTRKAPFHYGWDWGPRLVTSGIWRAVNLHAWDSATIEDVYLVTQKADKSKAIISVDANVMVNQQGEYTLGLWINGKLTGKKQKNILTPGAHKISFEVTVNNPELWWPNGLGNATLYDFDFRLEHNKEWVHRCRLNYGIRTLKLVQTPDSIGHSFHFEVNGIPVFMKGANIIPSEVLTPSVTEETYRKMIENSVAANMNMLRVWGGAIYKDDLFYQLCDENGILVWQDFMFACALQPGDEAHLESIKQEAEYNVKRLRNHPSIALWCGNNENLMAWHHWGWKESFEPEVRDFVWKTYERIFYEILPAAVEKYDPKNSYWSSSPMNKNNQIADRTSGDEHDWTIWFGEQPFSNYWENPPRFVSEWGMQAFPSMATIQSFSSPQDYDINSEVMRHRQRSKMQWISEGFDGNDMIKRYMERYYIVPDDFERFTYVSQLLQAEAYKTAIEAHRSAMPHCMGSLYWQLNDCWPTISWATLDYFYRWKASHYAVKKAFEPIIVTAKVENGMVNIFTVSDQLSDMDASLRFSLMDFGGKVHYSQDKPLKILSNTANMVFEQDFSQYIQNLGSGKLILSMELVADNKIIAENILYFTEPKNLDLLPVQINHSIGLVDGGYVVSFESNKLVKNLVIEMDDQDARYSDNYFDLLPGVAKIIEIKSEIPDDLSNSIRIQHLNPL